MQFWHPSVRRGAAGLKPQRPPIVGDINMQKYRVEIGGSGYKSIAKIVTLHDNIWISSILPHPRAVRNQYPKGKGPRGRPGVIPFQHPPGLRGRAHNFVRDSLSRIVSDPLRGHWVPMHAKNNGFLIFCLNRVVFLNVLVFYRDFSIPKPSEINVADNFVKISF